MESPRKRLAETINPDGVDISIEWVYMHWGDSVFIPCIDTVYARKQVNEIARAGNWTPKYDERIEGGKYGLRVWKM